MAIQYKAKVQIEGTRTLIDVRGQAGDMSFARESARGHVAEEYMVPLSKVTIKEIERTDK